MALPLCSNSLLKSSAAHIGGEPLSKLAWRSDFSQVGRVTVPLRPHRSFTIKAASSVGQQQQQQQSEPVASQSKASTSDAFDFTGVLHVGMICENLERSLDFYQGVLGLELNPDRPNDKLPYRGAWFWVGSEMIHLMEVPNPDPVDGRPAHGGRDRHACVGIKSVEALKSAFDSAGIQYTQSKSGRPAIFTRDPDGNALEFSQPN